MEESNKDKLVFYHGTEAHINFLWDVLTEFRKELMGIDNPNLKVMRSFDDFFKDIHTIDDFIRKMDEQELLNPYEKNMKDKQEVKYNYLPGYGIVGLSANVSLFGNHKFKGSSSFAYLLRAHSERPAPSLKLLQQFFNMLGLDDEEIGNETLNRLQEYTKIFLEHFSSTDKLNIMKSYKTNSEFLNSNDFSKITDSKNGALLQMFITPDVVNQVAYISELVGDRLNLQLGPDQRTTYKPTDVLGMLRDSPEEFEDVLKENHKVFQNQNNAMIKHQRTDFDKDPNFIHTNVLEARILLLPEMMMDPSKVMTKTYYLHQIEENKYREAIRNLVKRDVERVREINPNTDGYFVQGNEIPGLDLSKNVTPIMIKGMIDSWKVDRIQDLGLINSTFTLNVNGDNGTEVKTFTPLSYALSLNNHDLALEIIRKGGKLEKDMALEGVFKIAINKDKVDTLMQLVKFNPSLLFNTILDKSLLSYAIDQRSEEAVKWILSFNIPQFNGMNPLIYSLKKAIANDATFQDYIIFQTLLRICPQYFPWQPGNNNNELLEMIDDALAINSDNNRLLFIKQQVEVELDKAREEFIQKVNENIIPPLNTKEYKFFHQHWMNKGNQQPWIKLFHKQLVKINA